MTLDAAASKKESLSAWGVLWRAGVLVVVVVPYTVFIFIWVSASVIHVLLWSIVLMAPAPLLVWLVLRRWRWRWLAALPACAWVALMVYSALSAPPNFERLNHVTGTHVQLPSDAELVDERWNGVEPLCIAGGWWTDPEISRYYAVVDAGAALEQIEAGLEADGWSFETPASGGRWETGAFVLNLRALERGDTYAPMEVPAGEPGLVLVVVTGA